MNPAPITKAYWHTRARLWTRYKLTLTLAQYLALCAEIVALHPNLHAAPTRSGRITVPLRFQDRLVRWVYCPQEKFIVSALPARDRPTPPKHRSHSNGAKRRNRGQPRPYRRPRQAQWDDEQED